MPGLPSARSRRRPGRRAPLAALTLAPLVLAGCATGSSDRAAPVAPTPSASAPATPSAAVTAGASPAPSSATAAPDAAPALAAGEVEVLATGLEVPWGIGFLPDGDALITERDTARVLRLPAGGGEPTVVTTVEQAQPGGEGGLLGLAVSPDVAQDRTVYLYVTTARDNRVVRFSLDAPEQVEPVLTGIPKGRIHNGGRIAFGPDGLLHVGTGDTGNTALAQDPGSLGGKVLRLTPDGQPAPGTDSLVLSRGHRNVQGLAFDDAGRVYAVEFGQNRYDEVNQVEPGSNGGWPEVEGPGDGGGRFLAPITTWRPEQASPSGAALVDGSLYVAALRGERLWRVPLDGSGGAGEPEALLQGEFGRLRTAAQAPDGSLWVLTSNRDGRGSPVEQDDRVLRVGTA